MEGQPLEALNWVLACYAIHLSYGNTIFCRAIKSATIKQYVLAAASLLAQFSATKVDPRRDSPTSDKWAPCLDAVFKELLRYEKVPNRREPLTMDMIELLCQRNASAALPDFHLHVQLYHWFVVSLSIGPRRIEWCQQSSRQGGAPALTTPDIDARDGLPRAFILADIECLTVVGARIPLREAAFSTPDRVEKLRFTWRFQKNNANGEQKTVARSAAFSVGRTPRHCRVKSMLAIIRCRLTLTPPGSEIPLALHQQDSGTGPPVYITNWDVTGMLRSLAAQVYNLNPANPRDAADLKRWSCHSLRVGACVLLHGMGFSATDIQFILRWKSDAFMAYLRNLSFLARRHADAIDQAAAIPNFV